MKRKKTAMIVLIFCLSLLFGSFTAYCTQGEWGAENKERESKEAAVEYQMKFFNWEAIENLENSLKECMPTLSSFDLKEEVTSLVKGEKQFSLYELLKEIGRLLFEEIGIFIKIGIRFILIVLLCNLLQTLSSSFKTKSTTQICFFVCYMVIIYSVIQSLVLMVQVADRAIQGMSEVMFICIPTLLAFMASSGYVSSSAAMAPVIIAGLNISTTLIKKFLLPSIISVILLQIISTMSEEFKIDRLIKLFYRVMKWLLRGILIASVSLLGIYKMTLPYVDMTAKKAALGLSKTFIPVIGDAVQGAVDFILSLSFLLKNAFSIGVIIWIVLIVSIPLIKILAYIIVYYIAGAVIEPLGDKKMAAIATHLAKGCEFIMSSVGIVAILCITVLLICMGVGTSAFIGG